MAGECCKQACSKGFPGSRRKSGTSVFALQTTRLVKEVLQEVPYFDGSIFTGLS